MATSIAAHAILATAEKGLNSLLQMDYHACEQIASLAGKVIAIESTVPNYTLFIMPTEQGLYLSSTDDIHPDTKITAPISLLLQLLLTNNKYDALTNSNIMLAGDSTLAYTFCKIFDELNPDWQYQLTLWFGPAIAGFIMQLAHIGNRQLQTGLTFAQEQLSALFAKVTSSSMDTHPNTSTANPITSLINTLQSKFGQS